MDDLPQPLVRPVQSGDWAAVDAAFAHSFLACRPPKVWDWRYQRSLPGAAFYRAWLAQGPDGRVLGFFGGTLHRCITHGRDGLALIGRDIFTLPHGVTGLGPRGSALIRAETAFHEACAAEAIYCAGFGLESRARISGVRRVTTTLTSGGWWTRRLAPPAGFVGSSCRAELTDFASPQWDRFWERRKERIAIGLVRDREFLSWRFDDRQGQGYWRFVLRNFTTDVPLGYLCLVAHTHDTAVIVDAALPMEVQYGRDAMRQVEQWLHGRGVRKILTFSSPGCPEFPLWPTLGFEPCAAPMATVPLYKCYRPDIESAAFDGGYAMTLADSDLF